MLETSQRAAGWLERRRRLEVLATIFESVPTAFAGNTTALGTVIRPNMRAEELDSSEHGWNRGVMNKD